MGVGAYSLAISSSQVRLLRYWAVNLRSIAREVSVAPAATSKRSDSTMDSQGWGVCLISCILGSFSEERDIFLTGLPCASPKCPAGFKVIKIRQRPVTYYTDEFRRRMQLLRTTTRFLLSTANPDLKLFHRTDKTFEVNRPSTMPDRRL